jgi:phage terminase large subunit-like protein
VKKTYSLAGFERFCLCLKTENGKPLKLEPFEKKPLRDHFRGATEVLDLISKGNGKSTIFAALGLYHLEFWPESDPEVDIGASSRDQATILFNQAAKMVKRSELEDMFDVKGGYRHIRLKRNPDAVLRVHPADAKTVDGVLPTLALVDELHRHPSAELYGVFRDGVDKRNGQMITMSTAGTKEDSPLGVLRKRAMELPTFKRRGVYSHARSADGSFVLHEWSLTDEDDLENLKLVKKANPASWITIKKLHQRKASPSMTPARWARFACGVWTEGEEPWLEPKDWDQLRVDIGQLKESESVWVAVSTGINPGYALAAKREDGGVAIKARVFEGDPPLGMLIDEIRKLGEVYVVESVTWGQTAFARPAEELEESAVPMVEFPYKPQRLSAASLTLKTLIQERKLRHDGDPALRAQVMAGRTKETEEGWRLVPTHGTRALIALAVACHQATENVPIPGIQVINL